MKLINKNKKNKGFTLIEIIVVLVIMVIMAAIAVPAVTGYIRDAQNSQYITEAHTIYTAVQAEEARVEAKNETPTYGASSVTNSITKKVADKLEGITLTNITHTAASTGSGSSTQETYVFTFTSNNGKNVKVTFTPSTDNMVVDYVN